MRLALPLAIAALLAGFCAGCGGSSSSSRGGSTGGEAPAGASPSTCGAATLQVTGVPCDEAKVVLAAWKAAPGCRIVGASHASCRIEGYLCIAARQGERAAVSCALPGKSILFVPTE
jgi:hypothetical protein